MSVDTRNIRRIFLPLVVVLAVASVGTTASAQRVTDCSEASIRTAAPGDATTFLDRAFDWIHRAVPYCQCVNGAGGSYRTDCSGFVSMVWDLPAPGHTTYSFAGGPWDDHVSNVISADQLRIGDAMNYPGSPSAGTGHIVLFGGWLNDAHSQFCSLEESHSGTPARVITRWVDSAYLPIRLASRASCTPHCEGSVIVGSDCGRGDCAAFGAGCTTDGLGTRCVFGACPAIGDTDVCLDDRQILHCHNGAIDPPGDCSAYAALCSTAGATSARCVSSFCVPDAHTAPVAHDGCFFIGGDRLHCDANGTPTREACPSGQQCSVAGGAAHCAVAICPADGETDVCASATEIGHCMGGSVIRVSSCSAHGGACSTAGGAPHCASTACVQGSGATQAHDTCLATGEIGHCDATGALERATECPPGAHCIVDGSTARCASTLVDAGAQADAGASDASARRRDGSSPGDAGLDGGPPAPLIGGCAVSPMRRASRATGVAVLALLLGLAMARRELSRSAV